MDRNRTSNGPSSTIVESLSMLIRKGAQEDMIAECLPLLRTCPVAREDILDNIAAAAKRNIFRNPKVMYLSLNEIRALRPDPNGERDLKMALGELQKLMLEKETAEAWVPELTYWAIMTVKSIGIELVKVDKFPINNVETTKTWTSEVSGFSSLSCMIVTGIHYSIDRGDSSLIDYIIKQAKDIKPVLDWILASIAISKPEFILSMLLKNAFETFRRASDENEAQLHALTVILEYLSENKPDIVTDCLLKPLTPHNEHVFMWTVYLIHILKSSIKKEKVELVRRITKQAAKYITPGLLLEMHKQKLEKHPDMKIDDIKANVSNISSESHSFDLMHIFVSIVNGDGEFEEIETEIRFVLRDILSNILDKLEDQSSSTKNETRNETNQMLNKITIPSTMTSVDPAYRLLRMTMISTDYSNRIFCLSKLLKCVKDLQAQTALVKLVKETFLNQEKDCLSKAISDAFEAPHDHKALLKNLLILTEVNETSEPADPSVTNVKKIIQEQTIDHLTHKIANILDAFKLRDPESMIIAVEIIRKLKLQEAPTSLNLALEAMTLDFPIFLTAEYDEVFPKMWSFWIKAASEDAASFSTILRFMFDAVRKSHKRKQVEFEVPEKKKVSLLEQAQKISQKAPNIMGVGIIGKGAKKRRVVPPEEIEEDSQLNSVVLQFIKEVLNTAEKEETKLLLTNTAVSLFTEVFCEEHPDIEAFWPVPVVRGVQRTNLEKDLVLLKSIPKLTFPLISVLTDDWRIFNRSVLRKSCF